VNKAVGFFWLSWRIVNKAVGFFWLFCGIFLVELEDQGVCDPPHTQDGKKNQTRVRYEFVLFMHFTTYFTIQLWSIENPTHPKKGPKNRDLGSRVFPVSLSGPSSGLWTIVVL